ncbi:MAG: hypothetical protein ACODAU_06410, partial [Myxococcota bacterium]
MRARRLGAACRWLAAATVAVMALAGPLEGRARAQVGADAPDVRNIPPIVMLLVDTSGSMERMPGCVCTTPGCRECEPTCSTASDDERNKWAFVLEALTGQWETFDCTREVRTGGPYAGEPDQGLKPDHFAPPTESPQLETGILDVYVDRAKFGLMTFDPVSTFTDVSTDLLPATEFQARLSDSAAAEGGYSYGEAKEFTFPGCGVPHMLDNGARNESAPSGRLISVGSDQADDREAVNQAIQNTLLDVRPFGGTPIAGMLDDVRHYFDDHPDVKPVTVDGGAGDPYASCRNRYVVLLTDGEPGADMRGAPVHCDTDGFECPYDLPENIAADLCQYSGSSGGCSGDVDGVFVVGFDINDDAIKAQLDSIADLGGTAEFAVQAGLEEPGALLADRLEELVSALALAVDQAAPGTTTRTQPVFATSALGADAQRLTQINSGFRIGEAGEPWEGVLERRRFECNEQLEPEPRPIGREDKFHRVLNERSTGRNLLTVVPNDLSNLTGHIAGDDHGLTPIGGSGSPRSGNGRRGQGGKPNSCDGGGGGGGGGGGRGGGGGGGGGGNNGNN